MNDREKARRVRRLKNVTVGEVSVVDSPANLRKFFLFKSTGDHAANMAQTLVESDRAAVNAAFQQMDFEQQQEFLMGMRALTKKVHDAEVEKGLTINDDGELAQMVYQVGSLSEDQKANVLDRIKKALAAISNLEGNADLGVLQKASLVDVWRTELGMIRLGLRDPQALEEFRKCSAAEREANFTYFLDANNIPIIQKRLKRPLAANATHEFGEKDGKYAWWPKQARDAGGKFK